ncbi:radical SAM protein [bacterium]|nr:radical SAM protein [bacterium]
MRTRVRQWMQKRKGGAGARHNNEQAPSHRESVCPLCDDLDWVDIFINNVRPYLFVRTEDNILIKRPNQAQKLNATGARLLHDLLAGQSIYALIEPIKHDPARMREIVFFLEAIQRQIDGTLDPFSPNPAVKITPFSMHFSRYPVLSELALTYRCNLACDFCYAGCNRTVNPVNSAEEMDFAACRTVLDRLFHQARVPSVSFTGGEPTLVDYLPEAVAYAKALGMRVNLITNGSLITRQSAQILARNGLDSAQVSLEGTTAAVHDRITGGRGSFERSVDAVRHFQDAGILVHTNTTINRANLSQSPLFPAFIKHDLVCDRFSMNLIIPTGSVRFHAETIVTYSEIGPWLEQIIAQSRLNEVEFMWYSPLPMCLFNTISHGLGNRGCAACDGLISIGANGDVLPCASFDDPVGNILEQDFETIWQSEKACGYRAKSFAHERCHACEHFAICNGACPLYWRQVGYNELIETLQPLEAGA